ncbi:MAG: hypothetical protein FJ160_03840 [Gammaproteobacteria bacterium]|nr:hypothetical protein [Gammaproteobacteria bacterium]
MSQLLYRKPAVGLLGLLIDFLTQSLGHIIVQSYGIGLWRPGLHGGARSRHHRFRDRLAWA